MINNRVLALHDLAYLHTKRLVLDDLPTWRQYEDNRPLWSPPPKGRGDNIMMRHGVITTLAVCLTFSACFTAAFFAEPDFGGCLGGIFHVTKAGVNKRLEGLVRGREEGSPFYTTGSVGA